MKKNVGLVVVLAVVLVLLAAVAIALWILQGGNQTCAHTWNEGTVTKNATCKDGGEIVYTCTVCGEEKTEQTLALTNHTYDHGCDTDCNICGQTRQTTHSTINVWGKDATNHWKECTECDVQLELAAHTPGPAATEETPQICTDCGYIIQPTLGHQHNYSQLWIKDKTGHWYACDGCEEKKDFAQHVYDNACDAACNTCSYTRKVTHSYSDAWTGGSNSHWHACSVCGSKSEVSAHVPGPEATATTAQLCTVCKWEIAPALGEESRPTEGTTTPTTKPSQGDSTGEMTYERYINMSGAEQQAFFASFADPLDFFDWHAAAKEEYEKNKGDIIIGEDGVIDLEEILKGQN